MTDAKNPPSPSGLVQLTVRLTGGQVEYVEESGPGNLNENLRRILEDVRGFYSLPSPVMERLARYAREAGLDLATYEGRREAIRRVLTERYAELVRNDHPPVR